MNDLILIKLEDLTKTISALLKEELRSLKPVKQTTQIEYITRKDTAKILGISLPTLNDWSKKGVIPSYRIQSRIRYKKTEVMNCFKQVQTLKYKL